MRVRLFRAVSWFLVLRCLLSVIFSVWATDPSPVRAADADIAVVVHSKIPVDNLSGADLRKILLGDRQFWSSNQRVTLLIRAPVARERAVLLKRVYQMSEAQFRQYWIAKVFRAETVAGPKIVYSNKVAGDLVRALPGAVAFIDSSEVPKDLKVLKIDGRLPGDKGYALSD
jgi:ABC-type phosphate transport system substrate-binding protein